LVLTVQILNVCLKNDSTRFLDVVPFQLTKVVATSLERELLLAKVEKTVKKLTSSLKISSIISPFIVADVSCRSHILHNKAIIGKQTSQDL